MNHSLAEGKLFKNLLNRMARRAAEIAEYIFSAYSAPLREICKKELQNDQRIAMLRLRSAQLAQKINGALQLVF